MQAFRTIIWVIIAVILTIFTAMNFEPVAVRILPGTPGTVAEMPLALLIVAVALLGFIPPFLLNLTNRWRLTRRIQQQDETIALLRTPVPAPAPAPVTAAPPAPAPAPAPTQLDPGPLL
jgi:lipopolysaccharide assembly protein A